MTTAEIISIGTELLLGEILDTNTQFLAKNLREMGIDLYRTMIIGDNQERISRAIKEASSRAHLIITTGGLGPTVDDPTREAVSKSMGKELVFNQQAWTEIKKRFTKMKRSPSENNKRQAFFPQGALIVKNPVGTAPAFIVDSQKSVVVSLPGVPKELEYLFLKKIKPYLKKRFQLNQCIKFHILHTSGIGESTVDEIIGDLEKLENPTIGLLAKSGQVDIRVTAKAETGRAAEKMMLPIISEINNRLPGEIFGVDGATLPNVVTALLKKKQRSLRVFVSISHDLALNPLSSLELPFSKTMAIQGPLSMGNLVKLIKNTPADPHEFDLGYSLVVSEKRKELNIVFRTDTALHKLQRYYAGPEGTLELWTVNTMLDFVRRNLS